MISNSAKSAVLNTIRKSIKHYAAMADYDEDVKDQHFEYELDFPSTYRIVGSSLFRPDEWLSNIEDIRPILLPKRTNFPESLTRRIKALFRSYIFGNWLGVLALGRAVLEFALKETAPSPDMARATIDILIKDKNISEQLRDSMNRIQERGNAIMHPIHEREISEIPYQKSLAQKTIKDLIVILEELYRR